MAKIVRRVRQAGVYFVTTDTWERHALFINTVLAGIVVEQIVSCRDRGFYKLHAFALMPEHLHMLLTPGDETTIEKEVQMIKGGSAHQIGIESYCNFILRASIELTAFGSGPIGYFWDIGGIDGLVRKSRKPLQSGELLGSEMARSLRLHRLSFLSRSRYAR